MKFSEIPGSTTTISHLVAQVDRDTIPHAQIFLGRPGSPKLAVALAYACYILCLDKQNGDSCGVCKSCLKSHQLKHPDLHFAYPVVKKGSKKREDTVSQDFLAEWRNALTQNPYMDIMSWSSFIGDEKSQPNINTRECNDMIKQLGMRSFESLYKIQLIWLPEYLGKEGNRLLKMIEEPTEKTIIILVAEDQDRILNTVLSRCQITKINPVQDDDAKIYLRENGYNQNEELVNQAILISDGNLHKAKQILEGASLDYSDMLLTWMRLAYKRDYSELNTWISQLASKGREDIKFFLEYALSYMREYAFYLQTQDMSRLTAAQQKTVVNMAKIMDMPKVESTSLLLQECRKDIIRNINPRICLMAKSLELGDILRSREQFSTLFEE